MNLFKKKSFLNRKSSDELSELMIRMIFSIDDSQACWNGKRITLISLANDILCYERDNNSLVISAEEYEKIINLDYLIDMSNQKKIADKNIYTKLKEFLILLPGVKSNEKSELTSNSTSLEMFEFLSNHTIRIIPVLRLLDTKNH